MEPAEERLRRQAAGRYRSEDGRFRVESSDGAWYVTDQETRDELGQAKLSGPYPTLEEATRAVAAARAG
ncbi:MAG TPA: hypothetical protein VFH63_03940 [candidate division Zixibacteria bacterium]|nr:hypothetical protein [candidate division Zixibacteria bacterium]